MLCVICVTCRIYFILLINVRFTTHIHCINPNGYYYQSMKSMICMACLIFLIFMIVMLYTVRYSVGEI